MDHTQRQRAEAALQQERDRLAALVNSITDEIWFCDANQQVTLMNPAAAREFGDAICDEKAVEKIAAGLEIYRADGTPRPTEESPQLRALRGEAVTEEEIVRTPATGEMRHRQVSASPVRASDGSIIGSVSVVRDITDQKKAEERLRKSEERHRLLADTMLQGVVHQDANGTIIAMNRAAERILGKTPAEFVGSSSVGEEHHTLREDGSPFPGLEHPAMVALRTGQPVRSVVMGVFNPRE